MLVTGYRFVGWRFRITGTSGTRIGPLPGGLVVGSEGADAHAAFLAGIEVCNGEEAPALGNSVGGPHGVGSGGGTGFHPASTLPAGPPALSARHRHGADGPWSYFGTNGWFVSWWVVSGCRALPGGTACFQQEVCKRRAGSARKFWIFFPGSPLREGVLATKYAQKRQSCRGAGAFQGNRRVKSGNLPNGLAHPEE